MTFPAPALGIRLVPSNRVMTSLATLWTALKRRRVLGELGQMDDRMLRDIGITRFDVISAMAEPLFRDPTAQLVARVAETRMAARASARDRRLAGVR